MTLGTNRSIRLSDGSTLAAALLTFFVTFAATCAQAEQTHITLSPGDRVQIAVFGHEDLSGEFEIDNIGRLSLPLVEDIPAQGLTLDELEHAIVDALQPEFLLNPRVTAQLISLRPFYILGEVNAPGSYPYTGDMTVMRAAAVAGGFTHRARNKKIVIRRTVDGEEIELRADQNTEIQPGDVIEVPERFF
jgi:protein involved in polysaccharide export with SLBB domain